VQVDPIKPMLKAPGTKRLKLKIDELLSSFAFNLNLRRYTMDALSNPRTLAHLVAVITDGAGGAHPDDPALEGCGYNDVIIQVERCRFTPG